MRSVRALALLLSIAACSSPEEPARGYVVVDESGAPIAGAKLDVRHGIPRNEPSDFFAWLDPDSYGRTSRLVAAEDGRFDLGDVDGVVEIHASAPGFVDDGLWIEDPHDPKRERTVVLTRGAPLRGRVVWPDGSPMPGVSVRIRREGVAGVPVAPRACNLARPRGLRRSWSATTEPDGTFSVEGLPRGPFSIEVRPSIMAVLSAEFGDLPLREHRAAWQDAVEDGWCWDVHREGVEPGGEDLQLVIRRVRRAK